MARIKEIDIEGQKFNVASLTLSQVEEMFPSDTEKAEALRNLPAREHFKRAYVTVAMGLNNALPKDAPEDVRWDNQRINDTLDMYTFGRLHEAILEHSGLSITKSEPAGEAKAVTVN